MTTKDLEYTLDKLVEGKAYHIRVAAENEVGQGPWTELPEPVTARSAFGKKYTALSGMRCVLTIIVWFIFNPCLLLLFDTIEISKMLFLLPFFICTFHFCFCFLF